MLRHGRMGVAQVVAVAAIAVGALAAIYAERSTVREGFVALRYVRVGWLLAAFSVELVSMVALAQLERSLLRGAGAKHTLRSVLATAYSSNAISVTVPIIGSSLATAYAYRDFRRGGGQAGARQHGPDGRGRLLDRGVRGGRGDRRADHRQSGRRGRVAGRELPAGGGGRSPHHHRVDPLRR
jgi:hypothetical protein